MTPWVWAAWLAATLAAPGFLAEASGVRSAEFDTGMAMLQAFNHDAAIVHFERSAAQDPDCALCVWGVGVAHGVRHATYGAPYPHDLAARLAAARALAQAQGQQLAADLLGATHPFVAERQSRAHRLQAYIERMRGVEAAHPRNPDVQFLLADALLAQVMQGCHGASGMLEDDAEVLQLLERGLGESPRHPGLHHLMIHATERSAHPERGLPSARLLPQLEPDKGHMVHMPGHTYLRLGLYAEAAQANVDAIAVDDAFLAGLAPGEDAGWYYDALVLHNHHFLWFTRLMQQDFPAARAEAARLVAMVRPQTHQMPAQVQFLANAPVLTAIRTGEAVAVDPNAGPYVQVLAHLANGLAATRAGDLHAAQASADALAARTHALVAMHLQDMGAVAQGLLTAELLRARGAWPAAEAAYVAAVAQEDALPYMEPWAWQLPVREFYAAALLAQGDSARAVQVCDEELARHPRSPYALALRAQAAGR